MFLPGAASPFFYAPYALVLMLDDPVVQLTMPSYSNSGLDTVHASIYSTGSRWFCE